MIQKQREAVNPSRRDLEQELSAPDAKRILSELEESLEDLMEREREDERLEEDRCTC